MSEESLMREYDIKFKRFYNELHKYNEYIRINKDHKKLKCIDCKTKKKLIINSDKNELTYSCGPLKNKDKKCGFQFSIGLPEYINFREYEKLYKNRINGSSEYNKQILEYDLDTLSNYMNVNSEFSERKEIIDYNTKSLKTLYDDYIKLNNLTIHIEKIKELYQKRNKNSLEKKKIMKKIMNNDLSEEEKHIERKKYVVLIRENKEFIDMITELRNKNIEYIIMKKPVINGDINKERSEIINIKEDSTLIDGILEIFKQNNGILSKDDYHDLIRRLNKKTEWSQLLFVSLQKEHKNSWKSDLQEIHGSIIKKPSHSSNPEYIELSENWKQLLLSDDKEIKNKTTFDEQVEILIKYYQKVDSSKSADDIRKIVNNRRPKDTKFYTRIPTKPWLELCDKLETKYKIHPLRMEENDTNDPNDEDYEWPDSSGWNTPKKKLSISEDEFKLDSKNVFF